MRTSLSDVCEAGCDGAFSRTQVGILVQRAGWPDRGLAVTQEPSSRPWCCRPEAGNLAQILFLRRGRAQIFLRRGV